ncbi:hypothetical protein [Campylobacter sp.]|uniref:hypothetical protein n=1 Tax=Campylobacter sp. TaxID=205 RepID=UPI0025BA6237|nr:hypothetical protein [Campylobacter sp.]
MKKLFIFAIAIIILIAMAYTYTKNNQEKKRELITTLNPLHCDLNIQDCNYDFNGQKVSVSLNPKPISSMSELKLIINNLGNFNNLNARVYGLNMYMGDIIPKFKKINNSYQAKLVLSSCTLDIMRFRIEFFENEKALDFYFDFDVKR